MLRCEPHQKLTNEPHFTAISSDDPTSERKNSKFFKSLIRIKIFRFQWISNCHHTIKIYVPFRF